MRRLLIALLLLPSLVNAQLTISNVRSYILSKTQAQIRPIDIRNVGYINAQYARQADSTATIAVGWGNHAGLYLPIAGGTLTGTAGAGFLGLPAQTSNPSTPASGARIFGTSSPAIGFVGSDGFARIFNNTAITATRTYSFPDASGEVMVSGPAQTMAGVKTFSSNISHGGNITPTVNGTRLIGSSTFQYGSAYLKAVIGDALFLGSFGTTNMTLGYNGGTTIAATLFNGGNWLFQNGGTHTNAGYLLDVTGTSRLNGNSTIGGNITPDADGTRTLGTSSLRWNTMFTPILQASTNLVFRSAASSGFQFQKTGTTDFVALMFGATNNWYFQNAGSVPTETNYRFTIDGTGSTNGALNVLGGASQFAGNVLPTTNLSLDLGATSFRWNQIYVGAVRGNGTLRLTAGTTNSIIFSQNSDSNTIGQFFANTGSLGLQAPGGLMTDDLVNRLQVAGSVKSTQYRLAALNTAPTSATDTGTAGEIRITSDYIYVCTATNTWVRSALTTW